jgi:hypothetical protein
MKPRIQLIHWNREESKTRADILLSLGYDVSSEVPDGPPFLKRLRKNPPDAVVIDLTRLPSQGRDIGIAVRHYKTTRGLPLVFVEGDPEKAKRIKELLPDAVFTHWNRIGESLVHAMDHPPKTPVKPRSLFEGYSGAPLSKKLGIKPHSSVVLIDAPPDFETTLGSLPEGAMVRRTQRGRRDLTLWFVKSKARLENRLGQIAVQADPGGLWIVWSKKGSGEDSDLTQQTVREAGLAAGWVDYKICSIDAVWSGLLFTRRR